MDKHKESWLRIVKQILNYTENGGKSFSIFVTFHSYLMIF